MQKKVFLPVFVVIILLYVLAHSMIAPPPPAAPNAGDYTLLLYDAASGTVPQAPYMNFLSLPPGVVNPIFQSGATLLDTTANNSVYAGWVSEGTTTPDFPDLNRADGFKVDLSLQISQELHSNNNRAGFSLIVLSDDKKGIELAFWENEIWAQNDTATGGLFTH
ncbi:MAG TPA: hypothetical protein PK530_14625, partial [Anaerolineales bacterium]|nr:hypothetical protein [Anaerolineales bacterium]